jgi:hypothetical protein
MRMDLAELEERLNAAAAQLEPETCLILIDALKAPESQRLASIQAMHAVLGKRDGVEWLIDMEVDPALRALIVGALRERLVGTET